MICIYVSNFKKNKYATVLLTINIYHYIVCHLSLDQLLGNEDIMGTIQNVNHPIPLVIIVLMIQKLREFQLCGPNIGIWA
jgi:hypothetical protein